MDSQHFLAKPVFYKFVLSVARHVPSFLLYAIADRLTEFSYLLYSKARANVKANIRRVFPDAPEPEIKHIAFNVFRNYGRYICDYGKFLGGDRSLINRKFSVLEGEDNLKNALQMKKGIILLTAHLGNWELGGTFFSRNDIKTNVITLRDQDTGIDSVRTWYRKVHDVNTITIGDSPFSSLELISAINRNEMVAMLIDRYEMDKGGVEVEFFGSKTYFPVVPFWLGKMTQAPIVPAFVVKEKNGYRGIVEKPLIISNESDMQPVISSVVDIFEQYIKKYPDQWYNFVTIK